MEKILSLIYQSIGVIIEEGLIFLLILTLNFLVRFFIKKSYAQIKASKGDVLHESFVAKLAKPLRVMIWLVGLFYMLYVFAIQFEVQDSFHPSFIQLRNLAIIFCITWISFEIKKQFQIYFEKKQSKTDREIDQGKLNLLSKLASMLILFLALLVSLQTIGVNISTLIAFGGVGGLAISFASKDIVANYFSGFMLHVTRPFKIGDWIYTTDHSLDGVVEYIGYYITIVRGLDKRPFYVPNALFSSKMIVNASRMSNRRIKHTIGVRYDDFDKVEVIVDEIREMLRNHEAIDTRQHLLVDFNEYGPSSLNILIYTFTKTKIWKHWLDIQQEILLNVGRIIRSHGAEIAYPTTTIDLPKELMNEMVTPKDSD
ncbi:MAG: hypothetical protein S4CHLAM7_15620 [Chlamydiae bacterium]|nr:hypothetical protein [Chlamydiota bacterium]